MGSILSSNPSSKILTDEEKQSFWKRFDNVVQKRLNTCEDDFSGRITRSRIEEANRTIKEPDMKKVFEQYSDYWVSLLDKNLSELCAEIQPKWNLRNSKKLTEEMATVMCVSMMEYRLRGYDMEYFTNGFGSTIS